MSLRDSRRADKAASVHCHRGTDVDGSMTAKQLARAVAWLPRRMSLRRRSFDSFRCSKQANVQCACLVANLEVGVCCMRMC